MLTECARNGSSDGTKLYSGLDIVSDLYFEKRLPDTFSSRSFREHMIMAGYSAIYLCGLDECGCVGATAKGAVKAGIPVRMIRDCIGRRFPEEKVQKKRRKLRTLGIRYTTLKNMQEKNGQQPI